MQELSRAICQNWQDQVSAQFDLPSLYDFQKQAIQSVLDGCDTLVIVPTGGGKSYCYAGASALLGGLTLVVSPLIALMRDQCRQLRKLGLRVAVLDSLQSVEEKIMTLRTIEEQSLDILLVSPERLALPSFRELLGRVSIDLMAVDEAHCVNHWGRDFRPDYAKLGSYLKQISPAPIMALTATATAADREQIRRHLAMREASSLIRVSRPRENLVLKTFRARSMDEHSQLVLQSCLSQSGSGIIYAATRKRVEQLAGILQRAGLGKVGRYHGGLDAQERQWQQDRFLSGEHRITVATNAFGLGIHKADIRFVFHANMPASLEAYVQELGRAGRDGNQANCYLFYGPRDYYLQKFMIEKQFPSSEEIKQVYPQLLCLLDERVGELEENLYRLIIAATALNREAVKRVFDFLYRDDVLQRLELIGDQWFEQSSCDVQVQWGQSRSLISLLADLDQRRQERFERLNAIHRMVKNQLPVQSVIEEYFQ